MNILIKLTLYLFIFYVIGMVYHELKLLKLLCFRFFKTIKENDEEELTLEKLDEELEVTDIIFQEGIKFALMSWIYYIYYPKDKRKLNKYFKKYEITF